MKLVIVLLPLLATAAHAEGWTCRLTDRCVTGDACVQLATPVTASLSFGDNSLRLSVEGETSDMARIDATPISDTFFRRIDDRRLAFLTLFRDGTLTLSSHDAAQDTIAATASVGTCTRAVG
jgi:hypothetical protein